MEERHQYRRTTNVKFNRIGINERGYHFASQVLDGSTSVILRGTALKRHLICIKTFNIKKNVFLNLTVELFEVLIIRQNHLTLKEQLDDSEQADIGSQDPAYCMIVQRLEISGP